MIAPEAQDFLTRISLPLSDGAPAGVDLREGGEGNALYSDLRDARAAARAQERARDDDPEQGSGVPEEWRVIETLSRQALLDHTRDVEIACWLAEALTRQNGLAGLNEGSRVIETLVRQFWDHGLYPKLEDDDPEARSFPVSGLSGSDRDGSLIQPLRQLVLFEMNDGRPIAVWEYQRACDRVALSARGEQVSHRDDGLPSLEEMENIARGSSAATLGLLARDAEAALAGWTALQRAFEDACRESSPPAETPSTARVLTTLETICAITRRYVPQTAPIPESAPTTMGEEPSAIILTDTNNAPSPRGQSREEMLDSILQTALRLREMEPHSPFSYTIENAVRRARLTLPDLLREIVEDDSARLDILTKLGIQTPEG